MVIFMRTKKQAYRIIAWFYFFFRILKRPKNIYVLKPKEMLLFKTKMLKARGGGAFADAYYFLNGKTGHDAIVLPISFNFNMLLHEAIHAHIKGRISGFWNEFIAYYICNYFSLRLILMRLLIFFAWFFISGSLLFALITSFAFDTFATIMSVALVLKTDEFASEKLRKKL